jgi:hypothetical protein
MAGEIPCSPLVVNAGLTLLFLFCSLWKTGDMTMTHAPISAHYLNAVQIGESVDENGKPVGILTLGAVEGSFDFVITDKAADIIIEAMEDIKDAIRSN